MTKIDDRFRPGDVVMMTAEHDGMITQSHGVIIHQHGVFPMFGVDFGPTRPFNQHGTEFGHNLDGRIDTPTGWNIPAKKLKLIEREEPLESNDKDWWNG